MRSSPEEQFREAGAAADRDPLGWGAVSPRDLAPPEYTRTGPSPSGTQEGPSGSEGS